MKWTKKILVIAVITLVAMQFVPVEQSNPSDRSQPAAAPEIQTILRRACFDCHSNETRWPWYTQIAPISFLVTRDVKDGRKELNFSTWERYDERRKIRKLKEIVKQVQEGDMPPWYYVPVHREAKLSSTERDAIVNWAKRL